MESRALLMGLWRCDMLNYKDLGLHSNEVEAFKNNIRCTKARSNFFKARDCER